MLYKFYLLLHLYDKFINVISSPTVITVNKKKL